MKFKNIFSLIALFAVLCSSCESQLNVAPVSDITSAGYWSGEDDAQTYLIGIYSSYRSLSNTDLYSEARADLLNNGPQAPKLGQEYQHTMTADANGKDWKSWYTVIHHCNLLLYQIEVSELSVPDIEAQALTMRALTYFSLIKIFGEVPKVIEPTLEAPGNEGLARSSVSEILTLIKSDISSALSLYSSETVTSDRAFLTRPATLAAQADIYMWSGRFLGGGDADINTAIESINEIESSGGDIGLLDDYSSIFDATNEDNKEFIFTLYFDKDENGSSFYSSYGVRQDFLGGVDVIAVEYPDVPHSGNSGLNQVVFSEKIEAYYNENANDVRKDKNLIYITRASDGVQVTTMAAKFIGTWDGTDRDYDNDLIQYRWADMLLLRAEAYNSLSSGRDATKAVSDLNQVRVRAGIGEYSEGTDQATLEDEILKERARELCWENKRWEDLIRAGKVTSEVSNYSDNRGTDMKYIYWPISNDIMAQNSLLTQTPGY